MENVNNIRFDRLIKLADHLERGELGHKQFNYQLWHIPFDGIASEKDKKNFCGTMGCAVGECPMIFEEWHFTRLEGGKCLPAVKDYPTDKDSLYKDGIYGSTDVPFSHALKFFGLSAMEGAALFVPRPENHQKLGLKPLTSSATAQEVGANIRLFCKKRGYKGES